MGAPRHVTHIGGVSYSVDGGGRSLVLQERRHWPDFWTETSETADVSIDIQWAPRIQPLGHYTFDTGGAWRLGQRGANRVFELYDSAGDVFAQLEINVPVTRATLHYRLQKPLLADEPVFNPFAYPLDQMISMYALAPRQAVAIHAAGVVFGGRCVVFPGKSGAGKTTLSRLLAKHHDARILSDERVVLRREGGRWWAYGTPWPGEGSMAHSDRAPVTSIFSLNKAAEHALSTCGPKTLFESLLPTASIPWFDEVVEIPTMRTLYQLAQEVPGGVLNFAPSDDVVDIIRAVA